MNPDPAQPAARLAPFGVADWLVDPKACQISREATVVKLRPQLVDLLVCLARRPGEIVLKKEILAEVWPGQFVAESGLSRCVAELRQALHDDAQQPRFIETVPKRGYRLIAPVAWLEPSTWSAGPPATPEPPSSPRAEAPGLPVASAAAEGLVARPLLRYRSRTLAALASVVAIGLVAFLMTRPGGAVVTIQDTVLLADVRNTTGDAAFDDALRLALAVNLEQAPFLRILPQEAVRAALLRSGRHPDERVVGPVALDVCRREGAAVLLAGSIALLGSNYVVGVEAIACATGESVGQAMTGASSKEEVLGALEQAASRVRERLGESRDSLARNNVPLARATTQSFDALVALSSGDASRDRGRHEEALTYYRQATELDPEFALAWARRGLTARNVDLRQEAIPALRRAFELRERVSQPERFFIEGLYHRFVMGDPEKAIETFRAWKRIYPGSAVPPNYIAATLSDEMGQYEAAVVEAREAVGLEPATSWPYNNLAQACMGAGLFDEAKKVVAEAARRGLDDWSMHAYLLILALHEGDAAAVEREVRWAAADRPAALMWLRVRAMAAARSGRLGEARGFLQTALDMAADTGMTRQVAAVRHDQAEIEALLGDPKAAAALLDAALSGDNSPVFLVRNAVILAFLGNTTRARELVREAVLRRAEDPAPLKVWLPVAEALVVAREGRPQQGLQLLQPLSRFERANDYLGIPAAVRGLIHAMLGQAAQAAAAADELSGLGSVTGPNPWEPLVRLESARALRDKAASLAAYDAFLAGWKDADPEARLLTAAQRERAVVAAR